ncbi:MAG: GxxExxY protein [Chloroflexi bacterium]|nr:MAG: GxxExxY protein [Chloroflexota bacterium]
MAPSRYREPAAKARAEVVSNQVIAAAIEVHRQVGPGLLESVYRACLGQELKLRGLEQRQEVALPVSYKGLALGVGHRLDLLVEDLVIVELKSVQRLEPVHHLQLLTYLRLSGRWLGLLINFDSDLTNTACAECSTAEPRPFVRLRALRAFVLHQLELDPSELARVGERQREERRRRVGPGPRDAEQQLLAGPVQRRGRDGVLAVPAHQDRPQQHVVPRQRQVQELGVAVAADELLADVRRRVGQVLAAIAEPDRRLDDQADRGPAAVPQHLAVDPPAVAGDAGLPVGRRADPGPALAGDAGEARRPQMSLLDPCVQVVRRR